MLKSFDEYVEDKSTNQKIRIAAHYIALHDFPIKEFVSWYIAEGYVLSQDELSVLMEGIFDKKFWGDTWKGAKSGAGYGAGAGLFTGGPGGAVAGGAAGGLAGGLYGAGKNLWGQFNKWRDKTGYNTKQFTVKKTEAIRALGELKNITGEIGSGNEFVSILDDMIQKLSAMKPPAETTPAPSTPQGTQEVPPTSQGSPVQNADVSVPPQQVTKERDEKIELTVREYIDKKKMEAREARQLVTAAVDENKDLDDDKITQSINKKYLTRFEKDAISYLTKTRKITEEDARKTVVDKIAKYFNDKNLQPGIINNYHDFEVTVKYGTDYLNLPPEQSAS